MRLFLNILYEFKKTEKLSELFATLQKVLAENQWEQQRILFNFEDINDAKTKNRTPHQMLSNAFPQMNAYWKSSFSEYQNRYHMTPPAHNYSYFSNFPGKRNGEPVLPTPDDDINISLIKNIFEKIPRPWSFNSALAVLDGIDWFGDCDLSPAMNWGVIYGKSEQDEWEAGYWPFGMDFDEICPFYQSNSVRIGKKWGQPPEMAIQVEVYSGQGIDSAGKVEAAFTKYFGSPSKRYARAVYPWKDRESYHAKSRKMKEFFAGWSKQIEEESQCRLKTEMENPSVFKKMVSRATLKKKFYAANKLEHYPLSRWDDARCFRKLLPHNYHLEVGIALKQDFSPQNTYCKKVYHYLYIECIGCNFELYSRLPVENIPSPDGEQAVALAFDLWQNYLDRFEKEVVPELFAIFGETPTEYIYDSKKRGRSSEDTICFNNCRF